MILEERLTRYTELLVIHMSEMKRVCPISELHTIVLPRTMFREIIASGGKRVMPEIKANSSFDSRRLISNT